MQYIQSVVKLSGECAKKSLAFEALSKEERLRIILVDFFAIFIFKKCVK